MTNQGEALTLSPEPTGARRMTRFAHIFILAIAGWLLVLGLFNLLHPSDWAMGDWLINYSGGFVRRGLVGQCASLLRNLHVPPLWTVLLVQWALYAVVLSAVWRLATSVCWNWWTAAFFFSPATLAFVLLDPPFAFRKEILLFALLAFALELTRNQRQSSTAFTLREGALLTLGCVVCLLAHEALIVFFPYLFAALYLRSRDLRRSVAAFAAPAVVSVALFAVVSHFPGNAEVARAVCASIGGTLTAPPSGICGGAIDYLAHDAAYAHREVVRAMLAGRYWTRLPWLFVLPLLPAAMGLFQLWRTDRRAAGVLLGSTALAWLLSISVFFYGTDWTRWIYIHSVCLMMLLLFTQRRRAQTSTKPVSTLFGKQGPKRWLVWASLLIYCLGWELTVYGQRPLYGSFVRFLTHNLARGHQ